MYQGITNQEPINHRNYFESEDDEDDEYEDEEQNNQQQNYMTLNSLQTPIPI